ncbi:hypothetical protein DFJ74DRAFT_376289 [Hyaloraphidium curvatum]|nr:hypothetical protein DFJ74DRAFT_376289 [Hyaloraphidium curvatum]
MSSVAALPSRWKSTMPRPQYCELASGRACRACRSSTRRRPLKSQRQLPPTVSRRKMSAIKSEYPVQGKVVLITGGASGFGADLANKIASRKPAVLVLADIQAELGQKVAGELSAKHGVKVVSRRVDLSDLAQVKEMVVGTIKEFGGLDVLVNNAGIADGSWPKAVDKGDFNVPPDSFVRMTTINYSALVYATELAIVGAKKSGKKLVVVNVASVAGLIPQKEPIYASGKAAVIHFTRCLADLAPAVRVNVVLPNAAPTPLFMQGTGSEFHKMMQNHMVTIDAVSEAMLRADCQGRAARDGRVGPQNGKGDADQPVCWKDLRSGRILAGFPPWAERMWGSLKSSFSGTTVQCKGKSEKKMWYRDV